MQGYDDEFKELLEQYEHAMEIGEPVFMDSDDLLDISDYYRELGRSKDAEIAMNRAYTLQPDSLPALEHKVNMCIDEGDYDGAEEYLSRMLDSTSPEYIYSRAAIWISQKQIEKAEDFLEIQLKDLTEESDRQDFILDVVDLYSDFGYSEMAMKWMSRAHPDNTQDFKELMGRTLFELGKYEDSERVFNELLDSNPFQKRYWNAMASNQFMLEDYGGAVTSSEYAIAIDPEDSESIMYKANALMRLENYEEALKFYQRYESIEPDDELGLLNLAACHISLGQFEEALEKLKTAVRKSSKDSPYLSEIYQEMSFAYGELKRFDEALEAIEHTTSLDCNHSDMEVIRGHILMASGRNEEASAAYQKGIQLSGNAPGTVMRVIISTYDNKYVEESYVMFLKFFESMKDNKEWNEGYGYMALVCLDLGKTDEFLSYLQKACKVNPGEAKTALSHLFPKDMPVEQFYDYIKKELKQ